MKDSTKIDVKIGCNCGNKISFKSTWFNFPYDHEVTCSSCSRNYSLSSHITQITKCSTCEELQKLSTCENYLCKKCTQLKINEVLDGSSRA